MDSGVWTDVCAQLHLLDVNSPKDGLITGGVSQPPQVIPVPALLDPCDAAT